MVDAEETIEIEGAYPVNEKTGDRQLHPAARRLDHLRRDYVAVLSRLGLRPGSKVEPAGKAMGDILDE